MRHRLRVPALVLAAAGFLALMLSIGPSLAGGLDGDAKLLIQLDDEWSKAAATRDAARVASFYAEEALAYPPGEPLAVGRAAAQKVWAAYFVEPTFTISWKTVHAEVSKSGELGYTTGTYEDSWKGPDGKLVAEKGKYVCIWKKQKDGSWKAVHDMWNTDAR